MGLGKWLKKAMGWEGRKLPDPVVGEISRVGCAQAHAQSRGYYVLMLVGDSRRHRLSAETFELAEALALAKPGDSIAFVAEPTGHGAEEGMTLISFDNSTLSKNLGSLSLEASEQEGALDMDAIASEEDARISISRAAALIEEKDGVLRADLIKCPHEK